MLLEEVRQSLNKKTSATYATYARKWMVSEDCRHGKEAACGMLASARGCAGAVAEFANGVGRSLSVCLYVTWLPSFKSKVEKAQHTLGDHYTHVCFRE